MGVELRNFRFASQGCLQGGAALVGLTDYSQVGMLDVWYKSFKLGAKKRPHLTKLVRLNEKSERAREAPSRGPGSSLFISSDLWGHNPM